MGAEGDTRHNTQSLKGLEGVDVYQIFGRALDTKKNFIFTI